MLAEGVVVEAGAGTADGFVYLVTTDPALAERYDMHDERDVMADE